MRVVLIGAMLILLAGCGVSRPQKAREHGDVPPPIDHSDMQAAYWILEAQGFWVSTRSGSGTGGSSGTLMPAGVPSDPGSTSSFNPCPAGTTMVSTDPLIKAYVCEKQDDGDWDDGDG